MSVGGEAEKPVRGWTPKRGKSQWRDFLTAEERDMVDGAERQRAAAKAIMAEATAIIAPIQNRAIHRATYAASKG